MSVQTKYGWKTPIGEAGGIIDIGPYEIDSFTNESATGMKFGIGAVRGTHAGTQIKVPAEGATAGDFEGIVVNRRTSEYDMDGKIRITANSTVSTMRYGRVYARVAHGVTVAYGDPVYMITSGDEAGYFTNASSGNVAIKAKFLGATDTTNEIAPVELFNGSSPSAT